MEETVNFILYSASWCQPCKAFKKDTLPAIKKNFPEVTYLVVDVNNPPEDVDISMISSIPFVSISTESEVQTFKNPLKELDQIYAALSEYTQTE